MNPNLDQLTLFAVDSLARTSQQPVSKRASRKALGLDCSTNSCESFAWWDRNTSCWRTSQRSLIEGWTSFSENWPKQGMTRNGLAYRRRLWAPATSETAGGALPIGPDGTPGLPTPSACVANDGEGVSTWMAQRERVKLTAKNGNGMGMPLTIAAQLLPTPTTQEHKRRGPNSSQQGLSNVENWAVGSPTPLLPTPQARDWRTASPPGTRRWERKQQAGWSQNLNDIAPALPTPTAKDHKVVGREGQLPTVLTPTGAATYLNPSFVEEMMGFPVGWTA